MSREVLKLIEENKQAGKASIEILPDGKKYVRADRQVIFGNDPDSWSEQLENYINGKIRQGKNVQLIGADGEVLTLTARTAGKISSPFDNYGGRLSDGEFERKVNAGAHIDELVQVSLPQQGGIKPDKNARHGNQAAGGWKYRDAYFLDFDGKYYECHISVQIGDDGNAVYNIGAMQRRTFPEIGGSSANGGAQSGKGSSGAKVAQTKPSVKPQSGGKASREVDAEYMAAVNSGDMETAQRMVDEAAKNAGYNGKGYHQTSADFTVFDTKHEAAGKYDDALPSGFFIKPTDKEIGVDGSKQMPLYYKALNTLTFNDREQAVKFWSDNIPGYKEQLEKNTQKDKNLESEYDKLDDEWYQIYERNYDGDLDSALEDIERREDEFLKNWNEAMNPDRRVLKDLITNYIKNSEYDSIHLRKDKGGIGKGTIETFIVFSPDQLKSADPVTYDDDGNVIPLSQRFNPEKDDIRNSIEIDPEVAEQFSAEAVAQRKARRSGGTGGKKKVSKVRSNTYEFSGLFNAAENAMREANEENYTYDVVSEKESMSRALSRLNRDFDGEVVKLAEPGKDWGGSDLDTAMGLLLRYRTEGRDTGDYSRFWDWAKIIQEKGTKGGQFIQAFAKYTRTGTGAAMKGAKDIYDRFKLNPADQKKVDTAKKKLLDGVEKDYDGAAGDAMQQAKGQKEPHRERPAKKTTGRKYTEKDKQRLAAETRRRKDAERLVREIYLALSEEDESVHGAPVKDWANLTGVELARKIAGRLGEPKQRAKTTMQIILGDLVKFAEEHALPDRKKAEGPKCTAIDIITDYLSNRAAYGQAWHMAKSVLRAQYANNQEKLDALDGFLGATIAYNAEGTDRTMLDAVLESADVLGISEKRILDIVSTGVTEGTIARIGERVGDELVEQVRDRMGESYEESFTKQLKDATRRHVVGIALQISADDQQLRLRRMETAAAKKLDIKLQELLTKSKGDKLRAAHSIADYLIRELDIPSSDAAIAAQRITEAFMDELADRADKRLGQMFAEKTPKAQEKRNRLLELIRLGGLTNSNVEDAVVDALGLGDLSRERQRELVGAMARFGETLDAMLDDDLDGLRELIREQAAVRKTKLSRVSEKVLDGETDAEYLRDFALAQLASIAGDFERRSLGAKISTFQTLMQLLNLRTGFRNLGSNQLTDLVASATNNVALVPDMVLGALTGQRTVGLDKSWASQAKRQGAIKGAGRNALEVNLDVSTNDKQRSKYGTAGRRTNSMAASGAFGRLLSHLEEVMGYELNTTDEFHKGSVRGETLESLARFVEQGKLTQEQANAFAEEEALYRSFQDDTLAGNIFKGLKTVANLIGFGDSGKKNLGLPVHDFGLGDLTVKYTQVPGALIHRGIEFSPLGYVKALYDLALAKNSLIRTARRGEETASAQRKLALDIGRATTGYGLLTLFTTLVKAGLLRRDDDDKDKNAKATHNAQGLSGTQLNVTGLGRWIKGEDAQPKDGDVLVDVGFLEPLDTIMTMAVLLAEDEEVNAATLGIRSLDGIWKAVQNTSAMQTINDVFQTISNHDEANDLPLYFQVPIEIASDSVTGFIPAPVRQLAQATDTTYRDQYRSHNVFAQTGAKAANAIPGLRQKLAPKITPLGEDKRYQAPALNAANALLNPGNISVYQSNDVVDELNRVYAATDDATIWPERNAPYSITVREDKYTLTPDERTQYQRTRGQLTAQAMEAVMGSEWYRAMRPSEQAVVLNWTGLFANYVAKKEMLAAREVDYSANTYAKYYAAWQDGTPIQDVVAEANSKTIGRSEEAVRAENIIAEAKIPEASREEAEAMSDEAKRFYAAFLQNGVADATAKDLATALEGNDASGHAQWRTIYDAAGKDREKAVTAVMTEDMRRNWDLARDAGVSLDDYIRVRENYLDLNENGKKSQDEWNATLDTFTFSSDAAKDNQMKGTLWQILTGSGSTKNNPYDKDAGQKVIDAKATGGGGGSGLYAPARVPTLRLPTAARNEEDQPVRGLRLPTAR